MTVVVKAPTVVLQVVKIPPNRGPRAYRGSNDDVYLNRLEGCHKSYFLYAYMCVLSLLSTCLALAEVYSQDYEILTSYSS